VLFYFLLQKSTSLYDNPFLGVFVNIRHDIYRPIGIIVINTFHELWPDIFASMLSFHQEVKNINIKPAVVKGAGISA